MRDTAVRSLRFTPINQQGAVEIAHKPAPLTYHLGVIFFNAQCVEQWNIGSDRVICLYKIQKLFTPKDYFKFCLLKTHARATQRLYATLRSHLGQRSRQSWFYSGSVDSNTFSLCSQRTCSIVCQKLLSL